MPQVGTWNGVRVMCFFEPGTKRAHVHCYVGGLNIRVDLETGEAYQATGDKRAAAKAIRGAEAVVAEHLEECREAWEKCKR